MKIAPKSITRPKPYLIKCEWHDGFSAIIKLEKFRMECPCALCKGEELMGKKVVVPQFTMFTPGMNDLKGLEPVGNYAVAASWGDGHDTGIYNWELLREIFEKHALTQEQIDLLEKKTDGRKLI